MKQAENTITSRLVSRLNRMSNWTLRQQQKPLIGNQKQPDVMMTRAGHEPVAIEAKWIDNPKDGTEQVRGYIGQSLKPEYATIGETLCAAMIASAKEISN